MTLRTYPIGILLVGSTGSGKDTQIDKFLDSRSNFIESQSVTTRKPRPDDIRPKSHRYPDGRRKYEYVTKAGIRQLYDDKQLIEYKPSQGDDEYGTPFSAFDIAMTEGKVVLTDINYQGAEAVYEFFGGKIRIVFLSIDPDRVRSRFEQRKLETGGTTDEADEAELESRIEKARIEKAWAHQYEEKLNEECPKIFYWVDASGKPEEVTELLEEVFREIFSDESY